MEENYKLEKEYTISYDLFRKAYREFQKKNVYPKSYLFMGLFLVIGVIYIAAAIEDPSSTLSYVLIFLCFALAFREWYNPRKMRRNIVDTVREMGELRYGLHIDDENVEFSTLPIDDVENSGDDEDNEPEELPEATVIPINGELSVQEYDEFFLLYQGKRNFYIIPKEGFTEYELETVRELNLRSEQSL